MQMLDKFRKLDSDIQSIILIPFVFLLCIAIVVPLVVIFVPETNASPSLKTEFSTHRHIDKELGIVCYTTYLIEDEEIKDFSMDCLALPPVYDYSEGKLYVQNRTDNQD